MVLADNMKTEISLIGLVVIILWGCWGFLYKYGVLKAGLMRAILFTNIVYSLTNFVIIGYLLKKGIGLPDSSAALILTLGTISGVLGSLLFMYALERFPGSTVIPLTALYPALSSVLAVVFLREKLEPTTVLGIGLAVVAGYLLTR